MKTIKVNFEVSLPEIRRVLAMLPRGEEADALVSMTDEQLEKKFIDREPCVMTEKILGDGYNDFVTATILFVIATDGINKKDEI
jgi:hypothetical protein